MRESSKSKAKIIGITQARLGSTRLPKKILRKVGRETYLELHLRRLKRSNLMSKVIVATTTNPSDDPIVEICEESGTSFYRGSECDVLDRFYQTAKQECPDIILRFTSDCPLIDPSLIDAIIADFQSRDVDYESNIFPPTYPDGLDIEIFTFATLERTWKEFGLRVNRSHVTHFIRTSSNLDGGTLFRAHNYINDTDFSNLRLTLDTEDDLRLLDTLIGAIGADLPWNGYAKYLLEHPELVALNSHHPRNESYETEVRQQTEQENKRNSFKFEKSQQFLKTVSEIIPLGSQTFSKSKLQYPEGVAPLYISSAQGSRTRDIDGNWYVDLSNALLSISLGHADPEVIAAVQKQLIDGTVFSLPHPLEYEVALLIRELVPCAEMVRFGKNGSDATSAAVRLARAYTGRDHVLVCGYHGWQDWYIGSTTRNLGVPKVVSDLTHVFKYNDIDSLKALCSQLSGKVAAVVMEPMNFIFPENDFLSKVRDITHDQGILLIFDETITGFRFAKGGAQEYFGVHPDIATLGKGLSNGFPLSAVVGRAEYMHLMEDIFFSTTFGGETVSLAAAKATLNKIKSENVIEAIFDFGTKLNQKVGSLIEYYGLQSIFSLKGLPCWTLLALGTHPSMSAEELRTLQMQELLCSGILMASSHNISYAHNQKDLELICAAYEHLFDLFTWGESRGKLKSLIRGKPLVPVFKVR